MNDLSQAFASAFFFRILLPGLTFAIGLHPYLNEVAPLQEAVGSYPAGPSLVFLVEVTFFGLVAYASTLPIYYVAQGLRLGFLTFPAKLLNQWRLTKKAQALRDLHGGRPREGLTVREFRQAQQLYLYLQDFPCLPGEGGQAEWKLDGSTRLGNIIATYETYPDSRYGIDTVAFRDHFLYLFPDEIRRELDSTLAVGTGMVLSTAAALLILLISGLLLVCRGVGALLPWAALGAAPLSDSMLLLLTCYSLLCFVLFNFLARVVHRDYGRRFRAAFDLFVPRFTQWLGDHSAPVHWELVARSVAVRDYAMALNGGPIAKHAPDAGGGGKSFRIVLSPVSLPEGSAAVKIATEETSA